MTLELRRATCSDARTAGAREWLVTNGIGGYAMGTVSGELTRAYHGYLVAALAPPLGRTLLLTKLEELATMVGRRYPLSTNRWRSGALEPEGCVHLERFELDGTSPVWTYVLGDALLEKRLWMARERNATFVRYTLLRASAPLTLTLTALANHRSHHARSRAGAELTVSADARSLAASAGSGPHLRVACDRGQASKRAEWWEGFHLEREAERGLDPEERHLALGHFDVTLAPAEALTITASVASEHVDADEELTRVRRHEAELSRVAPPALRENPCVAQLVLAADQLVVARGEGRTVIAGYPWFGDWGRDTMIALPGLTLATGRPELAREILTTWAGFVDGGMIPNRFPAAGEPPEYHTVDATLWYVEAVRAYVAATRDLDTAAELFDVLTDILEHHERGTRHRIRVDPEDGLLSAGEPGVQLTWMDARVGERVITPRVGKPVEINALFYGALRTTADLARALGRDATPHETRAERVKTSFGKYWNDARGFLFDVLDGPDGDDPRLRPNQIIAASLRHCPLSAAHRESVVQVCATSLYTPVGLRSLARGEPGYEARFAGPPERRDAAYHQGTVWGWLLGPFVSAAYAVYGDADAARALLTPMLGSIDEHGLGTLSEVFEPEPPFAPRGCIAQAWSVAEVLRVWHELSLER